MPDARLAADRAGRIFTLIFLFCVAVLGAALFLQHVENLEPCPWCIVQRIGFIVAGLIALTGALHRPGPGGTLLYAVLGVLVSGAGAAAAAYHVYLQRDAKRAAACVGSAVERLLDASGIGRWSPPLLQYDGPCTLKPWHSLGLSIPEWSFALFVVLFVVFLVTPFWVKR